MKENESKSNLELEVMTLRNVNGSSNVYIKHAADPRVQARAEVQFVDNTRSLKLKEWEYHEGQTFGQNSIYCFSF